jgi:hypothetical protein
MATPNMFAVFTMTRFLCNSLFWSNSMAEKELEHTASMAWVKTKRSRILKNFSLH